MGRGVELCVDAILLVVHFFILLLHTLQVKSLWKSTITVFAISCVPKT